MKKAILLNENDNVATLLDDVSTGEELRITDVRNNTVSVVHPAEAIPRGHKIALGQIAQGEDIIKYGFVIGCAAGDIKQFQYVHIHNLSSLRGRGDLV